MKLIKSHINIFYFKYILQKSYLALSLRKMENP